jgi:UDP-N-acetylmuramate dehydrogenase
VGGPAQAFFMPEDENDLAYVLRNVPADIPVTVIGAGSNLIVRDGGVPGVVVRLGRGFNEIAIEDDHRVAAGTAVLDVLVARAAQKAAIAGLAFLSGIPGTIGGALRMNGGAYGGETKDVLIEARGVDRQGETRGFSNAEMRFSYRHCGVPEDVIFTSALFQGRAGDADTIAAEMAAIKSKREASQPRNRTGGSTFKNPEGLSAWKLVDEAGCRGLQVGQAKVSELHSNFLINLGGASAADIETLGETVRARVKAHSGIALEWEIKRIGITCRPA